MHIDKIDLTTVSPTLRLKLSSYGVCQYAGRINIGGQGFHTFIFDNGLVHHPADAPIDVTLADMVRDKGGMLTQAPLSRLGGAIGEALQLKTGPKPKQKAIEAGEEIEIVEEDDAVDAALAELAA